MAKNKPKPKPETAQETVKEAQETTKIMPKVPEAPPPPLEPKGIDYHGLAEKIRAVKPSADPISPASLAIIAANIHLGRKFTLPVTEAQLQLGHELVAAMKELNIVNHSIRGSGLYI